MNKYSTAGCATPISNQRPTSHSLIMKMNLAKTAALTGTLLVTALSTGCHTPKPTVPVQSGFLSSYNNLVQVDASTWRYVDMQRLPRYTSFQIRTVKVMFDEFDGKPLTA